MKALFFIAAAALNATAAEPKRFEFDETHMGTQVRIVLYANDTDAAIAGARAAFRRFADLEQVMSDYRPGSEIMKLCLANDKMPDEDFSISEDLCKVLEIALDISKKSAGAFDVTIGPLSKLWRETRKTKTLPDEKTLTAAREKVGFQKLKLSPKSKSLRLTIPGMRLDFGGIGKGFAADEALAVLKKLGITSALVAASGDIAVSDPPPGHDGWIVDIAPLNPKDPPRKLLLKNAAVSTSGDLFQHVEINNVRYSHVLDPKTGMGLTGFRSVTVIALRGSHADALSKAASLMKPDDAIKLIEEMKGATLIVLKENDKAEEHRHQSPSFDSHTLK